MLSEVLFNWGIVFVVQIEVILKFEEMCMETTREFSSIFSSVSISSCLFLASGPFVCLQMLNELLFTSKKRKGADFDSSLLYVNHVECYHNNSIYNLNTLFDQNTTNTNNFSLTLYGLSLTDLIRLKNLMKLMFWIVAWQNVCGLRVINVWPETRKLSCTWCPLVELFLVHTNFFWPDRFCISYMIRK